uniref:NELF-A N-terminal domain-containing protein n=1 Tax=Auxenochlorella protothecoides TaxID=3075 RepID=A0A1D2ACK1_AUXPR
MAARDLTLHISSKLAGEWSAPNVAGMLTAPVLEYLVSKWSDLDTMVKTRLLLAPLAMKGASLEELRPQLQAMVEAGVADKDEWVRVMALAVGPYDGRIHLGAVAADFKLVGKTLDELVSGLREADPLLYRPQEVGSRSCTCTLTW